jgi:hypothetical protein
MGKTLFVYVESIPLIQLPNSNEETHLLFASLELGKF